MAVNVTNRKEIKGGPDADVTEAVEDEGLAITLHLRSSPSTAAARRQRSVLDRLEELATPPGALELSVERLGSRVTVPERDDVDLDGAVALYEELAAATDEAGARLEPFFEEREVVNGLLSAGPTNERLIVFPVVSLTVRRDGDLTGLYPCWKDGEHRSVEDALGALTDGDAVENL
jgi:hypothetical protein